MKRRERKERPIPGRGRLSHLAPSTENTGPGETTQTSSRGSSRADPPPRACSMASSFSSSLKLAPLASGCPAAPLGRSAPDVRLWGPGTVKSQLHITTSREA